MKTLYLTLNQAKNLASDLAEYSAMKDSSDRDSYKGFKISFGDLSANEPQSSESMEMTPIPEFTEIDDDD